MAAPNPELMAWKQRHAELELRLQRELAGVENPEQQWVLSEVVRQQVQNPEAMSPALQAVWSAGYERKPVGVREFITGPEYLNQTIGELGIYPKIVDAVEALFKNEYTNDCPEVILAGSIGWGKSTFGKLAFAYEIYKLSCLKDPAARYGMKTGSNLTFLAISKDKQQAKKVLFDELFDLIKAAPYFNNVFPYDRRRKNEILFPKNIHCYAVAGSEGAVLGVNIFSAFMDEVNFMDVIAHSRRATPGGTGFYDQAQSLYDKVLARMFSRTSIQGRMAGHIYASSSARYPDDFTARMGKRAQKEHAEGKRNMLFLGYALWETIPEGKISKQTFAVEVGDLTRRTRVLQGDETNVLPANVIHVPIDFRTPFERDPDTAVRDLAGKSVYSIKPFIQRRELIAQMFGMGKVMGLQHPFSREQVTLQDKDPHLEYLIEENLHWVEWTQDMIEPPRRVVNGKKLALFSTLYYAHMDLAKTNDSAGLAICHAIGTCKVPRFDPRQLKDVYEVKPVIRVDLVLRINPPAGSEITIPGIRSIFYQLHQLGMQFGMISADFFGSQETIFTLKAEGYNADLYSVDLKPDAYVGLRQAIYDGRLVCYHYPVLERELAQLEDTGKKVDHPAIAGSSKDVADALAAAVHHCEAGWQGGQMSRGLFQIGLTESPGELPEQLQKEIQQVYRKVASEGKPLDDVDEDVLLFRQYFPDM